VVNPIIGAVIPPIDEPMLLVSDKSYRLVAVDIVKIVGAKTVKIIPIINTAMATKCIH